jgi:hypothetical protein
VIYVSFEYISWLYKWPLVIYLHFVIQFAKYSLYLCRSSLDPEHQKPVMGSPYLEETVAGLKFRLSPTVKFWNNIHAAKMVCKGVEELLAPTKRISLVEIGFGLGLVGLHLSRVRVANAGICPLLLCPV